MPNRNRAVQPSVRRALGTCCIANGGRANVGNVGERGSHSENGPPHNLGRGGVPAGVYAVIAELWIAFAGNTTFTIAHGRRFSDRLVLLLLSPFTDFSMAHFAEFRIPGTEQIVKAALVKRQESRDSEAWVGQYWNTIRLFESLHALRLHGGGAPFPNPDDSIGRPWVAGREGNWFAIENAVLTSKEFRVAASLPHSFSMLSDFYLLDGSVLNIGTVSNRFHQRRGGMLQAEFIAGPQPIHLSKGFLMDRYGHA